MLGKIQLGKNLEAAASFSVLLRSLLSSSSCISLRDAGLRHESADGSDDAANDDADDDGRGQSWRGRAHADAHADAAGDAAGGAADRRTGDRLGRAGVGVERTVEEQRGG